LFIEIPKKHVIDSDFKNLNDDLLVRLDTIKYVKPTGKKAAIVFIDGEEIKISYEYYKHFKVNK
jgi:hypothetical protein